MWGRVTTSLIVRVVGVGVGVGVSFYFFKRVFHSDSAIFSWLRNGIIGGRRELEFIGRVTRICLYPVKACNGVYVEDAFVGNDGLRLHRHSPIRDRHWGILEIPTDHIVHMKYEQNFICMTPSFVNRDGKSVTRNFAEAGDLGLLLSAPDAPTISLPVYPVARDGVVDGVAPEDVKSTIPTLSLKTMTETKALHAGQDVDEWINRYVGKSDPPRYRLMVKPAEFGLRKIESEMSFAPFLGKIKAKDTAAFQAVAPLQILNEASVDDLNERLLKKYKDKNGDSSGLKEIAAVNFRSNIIVDGGVAYDEDAWEKLWIAPWQDDMSRGEKISESSLESAVEMRRVAPCQRCTITVVDPETGKFRDDNEPLRTLMGYRRVSGWGSAPVFGSYVGVDAEGPIKIGDAVFVVRKHLPKPIKSKVDVFEKFWGRKI